MNKMNIEKGHLAAEWRADGESEPGARRRLRTDLRQITEGTIMWVWTQWDGENWMNYNLLRRYNIL